MLIKILLVKLYELVFSDAEIVCKRWSVYDFANG